jgi:hypothetical protein
MPLHDTVDVERPTAPGTYPPIHVAHPVVSPVAVGVAGLIVGGLAGAGYVATRKMTSDAEAEAEADASGRKE